MKREFRNGLVRMGDVLGRRSYTVKEKNVLAAEITKPHADL